MVFSSLTFLLYFLPIVVLLYLVIPNDHARNAILIIASVFFYAWGEPKWVFVMLAMVAVNYGCGRMIARSEKKGVRLAFLLAGVIFSLGFLFYFKYANFLTNSVLKLFHSTASVKDIALPIGISFYTFQVLTYIVDVYKKKIDVQKNFFLLLLYVSFFPQLIAGPIVNYKDIEKSLRTRVVSINGLYHGFLRFIVGLAKKCLLANTCGEVVNGLDGTSTSVGGAWILAICFSLQLYFDFSGYSDMAIGLGEMFGFRFKENFTHPYMADSATDFWRRWHISLGAFFREYVYIPLGGNRCSKGKWVRNLLIVWALTGIWHGASWNFVVWGLYYGILLLIEKQWILKIKERIPKFFNVLVTLVFVILGWVLFYYTDLGAGISHIGRMFGIGAQGGMDAVAIYYIKDKLGFVILAILACLPWSEWLKSWKKNHGFSTAWRIVAPVAASFLLLVSVLLMVGQSYNPFLYFRF